MCAKSNADRQKRNDGESLSHYLANGRTETEVTDRLTLCLCMLRACVCVLMKQEEEESFGTMKRRMIATKGSSLSGAEKERQAKEKNEAVARTLRE